MEGTVTIPIEEYELLTGIKKDFDEKLKSELKRMNDGDRAFVLRDRDEYIRRNELLFQKRSEAQEEIRKVSEANVKLRLKLDSEKKARKVCIECVNRLRGERASALALADKVNDENKQLRAKIANLKGRLEAACHMDDVHVERLMGRGLLARVFNRRPW